MKKIDWSDVAERAAKTFLQSAFSYAALNVVLIKDKDTGLAVLVGAGAAGISAVWNSLKQLRAQ